MTTNRLPQSLVDHPRLSQWVEFGNDTVNVFSGKVELGQGILTALTQIAADELSVDIGCVQIVSGRTAVTPDENFTAGSHSIEISGMSIRMVCAEIRETLLRVASDELGVSPHLCSVENGNVVADGAETEIGYWSRKGLLDLDRECSGSAPLKLAREFRYVGRDIQRVDLLAKVTGGGFIHDMTLLGMRHARILRGPVRGARLVRLDMDRLDRLERVETVQFGGLTALISDDVHRVELALSIAEAGCEWDVGRLSTDIDSERWQREQRSTDRVLYGAPTQSDGALTVTVSRPYLAHGSIGPACALARMSGGRLEVWTHSQGVGPLKRSLARALGMEADQIAVLHVQGAGCYGHNGADDVAFDAAFLATKYPGVPIRVLWSRKDELSVSPFGAAMVTEINASLSPDGAPTGWRLEIWSGTHGTRPGMGGRVNLLGASEVAGGQATEEPAPDVPDAAGGGAVRNAQAPYEIPDQSVIHHLIQRPALHSSALRGLGTQVNVLAIESMMDELAERAGIDPLDYRLRFLADPRARAVLEDVAERCAWKARGEAGSGAGLGIAYSRYKNRAAYVAIAARVDVDEHVRLTHVWCSADAGLVISPDGTRNQLEGGIIQAASWTLKEAVRFDEGGILTGSWETYPILRFSEVPLVDIAIMDAQDAASLGVGEAAVGPVTAAIANAVAHALGLRIGTLPLTREQIARALLAQAS
ncbi:MAG: xanthine dehydrogenase family protein molybdopterin-binding subunit [Mesorhizobium sp.]|uniref:xanthine dehydrogenase family protein molybdopterin-binding subunit n=1 Tax=Mesorhizobium sp. TaxID=1871066 RepID=UPI000FE741C7|nr:molybdopterin cofactor-binding domain-containing protein [Mesorhizobium sp.]RWI50278.1 MAG: xanthine dehydrogenase family protein molybdopterin-binding subunit [Mesorhizobium sp.]